MRAWISVRRGCGATGRTGCHADAEHRGIGGSPDDFGASPRSRRILTPAAHAAIVGVTLSLFGVTWALAPSASAEGCPNEALRSGYSAYLPDCRSYEQVSPAEKNGGDVAEQRGATGAIQSGSQASSDGNAVAFQSYTSLPGSQGAPIASQYLARRGEDGWSTEDLNPTNEPSSLELGWKGKPAYQAFSEDLSTGFLQTFDPPLAGAPAGYLNLDLRDNNNGSYLALSNVAPTNFSPGEAAPTPRAFFEASTPDWSHVVFASEGAYLAGADTSGRNIYEWSAGGLRLVNVLPKGETSLPGEGTGAGAGGYTGEIGTFIHAISDDGSRIFWTDESTLGHPILYLRENGAKTIQVDASQRTPEVGSGEGHFAGASADGSVVFFTDELQLTNESNANVNGADLYRYDVTTGKLTDITAGAEGAGMASGDVLGISSDGSYVYFLAKGILAPGATGEGPHLYLWHDGKTSFITDPGINSSEIPYSSGSRTLGVTPDGLHFAFTSSASLTGFDNEVATGTSCGTGNNGETLGLACTEVYLYNAVSNELTCASCNPDGSRPTGRSTIPPHSTSTYQERFMAEDGRLFFNSYDALVPRDTNGNEDVYEYEDGEVHLISSGTGAGNSSFADASTSGDDVFFVSRAQLVGWDTDQSVDLYDARVDGGFPEPSGSARPCGGESCRGGLSPAPSLVTPSSTTIGAAGNLASAVAKPVVVKSLTRAEKLAKALKACRSKPKSKRRGCEVKARKSYGSKVKKAGGSETKAKPGQSTRRGK
jgi:hypothetical protein